ncbi:MAG: hypothetical protein LBM77_04760 [Spirochaetaceae bacterium]|jgi:hypothetical protein|nr:hypothetical protein [Spirochaetaceae bacterium]
MIWWINYPEGEKGMADDIMDDDMIEISEKDGIITVKRGDDYWLDSDVITLYDLADIIWSVDPDANINIIEDI